MASPALTDRRLREIERADDTGRVMTHGGVASALAIFGLFGVVGAAYGWHEGAGGFVTNRTETLIIVAIIAALVLSFVIISRPKLAKSLGIVYALLEGFAVGVISASYNAQYHGIVLEAVGATFGVALCVWFLYGTGLIKVTQRVTRVITMAVLGAMVYYGVTLLVSLFGGPNFNSSGGVLGIGISLILAVVAASTFLLDFDRIDKLIAMRADREYDWYGAFGLLISFIWLYLEILNILGRLRGGGGTVRR
ncbi:MAG: Bax inhibitor-1/YccA family protein [Acidimicrobiales bacterium]